jgi:N-acetyl-anhydromuramyl-L-alanine amidase AmpD
MNGEPLVDDEGFGPRTSFALRAWQKGNALRATGVFGAPDEALASSQGFVPFVQARRCTILYPQRSRAVRLIVIHDMEYPETPRGAEWCAEFFAAPGSPIASAHYAVDALHVYQCVRDWDVAWHAPGANHDGIGIEHAGYASQSREDWLDDYSRAELERSAALAARIAERYGIPAVRLTGDTLRDVTNKGFAGHLDCTDAFSGGRGHVDPGEGFPWDEYLAMVTGHLQSA